MQYYEHTAALIALHIRFISLHFTSPRIDLPCHRLFCHTWVNQTFLLSYGNNPTFSCRIHHKILPLLGKTWSRCAYYRTLRLSLASLAASFLPFHLPFPPFPKDLLKTAFWIRHTSRVLTRPRYWQKQVQIGRSGQDGAGSHGICKATSSIF